MTQDSSATRPVEALAINACGPGGKDLISDSMSALLGSLAEIRGFVTERERSRWGSPAVSTARLERLDDPPRVESQGGEDANEDDRDLQRLFQLRIQVACLSLSQLTDVEIDGLTCKTALDAGDIKAARALAASISADDNVSVRSDSARQLFKELATPAEGDEISETDLLGMLRRTGRWPGDSSNPVVREYLDLLATTTARHARFALWVARRILGRKPERLFELASLQGLKEALEHFDPFRGNKVTTYASHWVRQRVNRVMADYGSDVRVPVHLFESRFKLRRLILDLVLSRGAMPKFTELVEAGKAIQLDVRKIARIGLLPPMDAWKTQRSDGSLEADALFDEHRMTTQHSKIRDAIAEPINAAVQALTPPRARDVIERRFQLFGRERAETLETIGQAYGLTRERIRQIEVKALKHLAFVTGQKLVALIQEWGLVPWKRNY